MRGFGLDDLDEKLNQGSCASEQRIRMDTMPGEARLQDIQTLDTSASPSTDDTLADQTNIESSSDQIEQGSCEKQNASTLQKFRPGPFHGHPLFGDRDLPVLKGKRKKVSHCTTLKRLQDQAEAGSSLRKKKTAASKPAEGQKGRKVLPLIRATALNPRTMCSKLTLTQQNVLDPILISFSSFILKMFFSGHIQ